MRRRGRAVLATVLLGGGSACAPPAAPPDVAYGNCETVVDGPVCIVAADGGLRLSVRGAGRLDVQQRVGHSWREVATDAPAADPRTTLLVLYPDPAANAVRVRADGHSPWQLTLGRETLPDALHGYRDAVRAPDRSGLESAASGLAAYAADAQAPRRGTALGLLARARLRQGHAAEAVDALRAAIDVNLAGGRRLEALRDTNVLVHVLYYKEARYEEVGALYSRLGRLDPAPAEALFFEAYYRGNAALEAGDGRVARARLDAAAALARRMGWRRREFDADQSLAVHLMQSGRRDQAASVLHAWRERGLPAALRECERAAFAANLGWLALLQLEAGEAAADPTDLLLDAQAAMDEHCTLADRVNARVNVALAHVHGRRFQRAKETLAQARSLTDAPGAILRLWALDIGARADLALGDVESARAQLAELDALAQITLSQDGRWRAAVGAARLALAEGDPVGALARFRAADRWLERDLLRLPVGGGRDSLLAARQGGRQEQMALLLELGRPRQALALARRSAAEVLAALDGGRAAPADADALRRYRLLRRELQAQVADSWTLPQDEKDALLARSRAARNTLLGLLDAALGGASAAAAVPALSDPPAGVVELTYFASRDGWLAFLHDARGVTVHRPRCADADARADCLLAPLASYAGELRRVRIVPSGGLWSVDFHAAVAGAAPLVERAVVDYALGLGAPGAPRDGGVLVVADSRGDLPFAREELAVVRDALAGHRALAALRGPEATSARVADELGRAAVFHFAGHARVAGAGGWQSELALASDTALTVGDVLALPAVPGNVVLSGCETAATAAGIAASIGLGQAFLVRGATAVVAAVRPVDDRVTLALMRELYARWDGDGDLSAALRAAQLRLRRAEPGADWAAFRAITR